MGINKRTVNNTIEKVYIYTQCVQMRQDKGGKAINRPQWQKNQNIAIKRWSDRCAEDECASRDTGVQMSKIYKYSMGMRELDGLFTDELCAGAVICELL